MPELTRVQSKDERSNVLGARQKLNAVTAGGIFVVASLVGFGLQSWLVFLVVGGLLTLAALGKGDIRPGPRRR